MRNIIKFLCISGFFIASQCYGQGEVLTIVESPPEFPGGLVAFQEYVEENLVYPEAARESRIEGHVFVQFIIETTGRITEVKTVKGIDAACDSEAEKVFKTAPDFIPGYHQGKPARVKMILPILFSLKSKDENEATKQPPQTYRPAASSVEEAVSDPSIKSLALRFRDLTELDETIGDATQLTFLNLTGNKLRELPKEIGALNSLKELHLTYNQLKELPATFSQLQSLRTLYLDRNKISQFPVQLLALRNLETLDISFTSITELPEQIAEMPNLTIIYARGTKVSSNQIKKIREVNSKIEILK